MSTAARALRTLTTRILATLAAAAVITLATCWPASAAGPEPGAGPDRALAGLLVASGALGGTALAGLFLASLRATGPGGRERAGR